jgi:hypothetical protein
MLQLRCYGGECVFIVNWMREGVARANVRAGHVEDLPL